MKLICRNIAPYQTREFGYTGSRGVELSHEVRTNLLTHVSKMFWTHETAPIYQCTVEVIEEAATSGT